MASALGNLIAGIYAGNFDPENVQQMPDLFIVVVLFGIGGGILCFILSPWLKRWVKTD